MGRRILVADDEPSTADMYALIFGFNGYDVERAYDGEEALALARKTPHDVIFLDVYMPKMRGSEVARALRADPKMAGLLIVLFSSADEEEIDWRATGADAFLRKPVDIRDLPGIVDRLLAARASP